MVKDREKTEIIASLMPVTKINIYVLDSMELGGDENYGGGRAITLMPTILEDNGYPWANTFRFRGETSCWPRTFLEGIRV